MSIADSIILFVIVLTAIIGFFKGFIQFSIVLIKWCGSIAAPFFIAPHLSNLLQSQLRVQEIWLFIISFIVLFLGVLGLVSVIQQRLLYIIKPTVHTHWLNKSGGVIAGVTTGVVLSAISFHVITASYWKEGNDGLNESVLAFHYQQFAGNAIEVIVTNTATSANGLQVAGASSTEQPFKKETFQTPHFASDAAKELQVLQLVNKERSIQKLPLLQINNELSHAAKLHGADMFTRGYFSHNTPEGNDPFQRLNALNIAYKYAGENLAYSYTITIAHAALMKSPGHKANILNPKFSKIGISVLNGGEKGLIVVQEFKH
jgi:uncharacterized protein YkwD